MLLKSGIQMGDEWENPSSTPSTYSGTGPMTIRVTKVIVVTGCRYEYRNTSPTDTRFMQSTKKGTQYLLPIEGDNIWNLKRSHYLILL